MLQPDEIAKLKQEIERSYEIVALTPEIEQEIERFSLDEPTKNLINGVIADRKILLDVFERLVETPENSRDEIFQEIAELIGYDYSSKTS